MQGSKNVWQWRWMQVTVLLTGMLAIGQILWVHRISESLQSDEVLVDTVLDAQINTSLYHLRLEEALDGYSSEESGRDGAAALDRAIALIDSTLSGKILERGRVEALLADQAQRVRAETIKSMLAELRAIGLERLKSVGNERIGSDQERRFETTFKDVLREMKDLENILEGQEIRNQRHSGLLFRSILGFWILLVAFATTGLWLLDRRRKSAEDELIKANRQLLSQTEELTEHRQHLEELVGKRTLEVTAANELLLNEIAERRQAEETLKESEKRTEKLASWLINAQEVERRRIAMELHDELGQALNATKLHLRLIENGLTEDQRTIREECEKLLEYMDHVIDDVRRLSLALSPTVLKDLGLTAAIRWLISGLAKYPAANITTDIENIDHGVPEKYQITIYRVLQEILTNIIKHAQAENVSIDIRRDDDTVVFSVEDDGKGFDPKQELIKTASNRGLGLATMSERVRMAGGTFNFWSREGKGTRITFSIPVKKEGA